LVRKVTQGGSYHTLFDTAYNAVVAYGCGILDELQVEISVSDKHQL
jgi:hypothetical protein